jgi:hypothetical protein
MKEGAGRVKKALLWDKRELIRTKQEHQRCQNYIDSFTIQINSKIAKLDIEREEP